MWDLGRSSIWYLILKCTFFILIVYIFILDYLLIYVSCFSYYQNMYICLVNGGYGYFKLVIPIFLCGAFTVRLRFYILIQRYSLTQRELIYFLPLIIVY